MKYVEFGEKKVKSSVIMAGTMRTAKLSDAETREFLDKLVELEINAIDCADIYSGGESEARLGVQFGQEPSLRDKFFLQTKCAIRHGERITWYDFSKEYILECVDKSLARLQTDHLDSLLLHRPDALMEPEEVAEAFDVLYRSGKVLQFGVSNMNPARMELLSRALPMKLAADQVQLSAAYTPMLDASLNTNIKSSAGTLYDGGVLEYCQLEDIVVQSWSSLQYGFFEGCFLGDPKYEALNKKLEELAEKYGVTPTAIALAFILRYPAKMQAIIGTSKVARLEESAKAADICLTREEWYEIYLSAGNRLP